VKFKVMLTFCCNRCILTEGGLTDKNHHGQNLPDKRPLAKLPRTIESEFVQGAFVRVFY